MRGAVSNDRPYRDWLLVRDTIKVGEAMREMLMEAARWSRRSRELPLCLHGPTPRHSHARYMPEDEDADGIIDHLTVFASGGLDTAAVRLLAMSERLTFPGLGSHEIEPAWMGGRPSGSMFVEGTTWVSRTPYVAPWFKDSFVKQIRKELPFIGIAKEIADLVEVDEQCRTTPREYLLARTDDEPPPSPPRAAMLALTFPEPVAGPIMLGYGSHFGLGQFVGSG